MLYVYVHMKISSLITDFLDHLEIEKKSLAQDAGELRVLFKAFFEFCQRSGCR